MQIEEIYEPHKTRHAVLSALILAVFFGLVLFSSAITWGEPPPPAAMKISLIPSIPTPPPPPEEPVPEPKPEPKPDPEVAAEAARQAEVIRVQEEEEKKRKQVEEKKKREEEKKRKEKERKEKERKQREEEKKLKQEEERKKREEEEQARLRAEAAAAEAAQQAALEKRTTRIADRYAGLIINRINDYLKTPGNVPRDSSIVVKVYVRLSHDGSLIGIPQVIESSGFPEYDDAAVRAVLQAAPLPIPKEPFIVNNEKLMRQFLEHTLYIRPE